MSIAVTTTLKRLYERRAERVLWTTPSILVQSVPAIVWRGVRESKSQAFQIDRDQRVLRVLIDTITWDLEDDRNAIELDGASWTIEAFEKRNRFEWLVTLQLATESFDAY